MGTIAKIHDMLVGREVSCTELTQQYLGAIESANGELNAYVTVTPDEARSIRSSRQARRSACSRAFR